MLIGTDRRYDAAVRALTSAVEELHSLDAQSPALDLAQYLPAAKRIQASLERTDPVLSFLDATDEWTASRSRWISSLAENQELVPAMSAHDRSFITTAYLAGELAVAVDQLNLSAFRLGGGDVGARHQVRSVTGRTIAGEQTSLRAVSGGPASISDEVNETLRTVGQVDDALRTRLGIDSWDGAGAPMRVTLGNNASWDVLDELVWMRGVDAGDARTIGHEFVHGVQRSQQLPVSGVSSTFDEASAELVGSALGKADWVDHPDRTVAWTVESTAPSAWQESVGRTDSHVYAGSLLNAARVAARDLGGPSGRRTVEDLWIHALLRAPQGGIDARASARQISELAMVRHRDDPSVARAIDRGWRSVGINVDA